MPAVTINLPDEVHRALNVRAAHHGRNIEAEMRDILEAAVRPTDRVKLGSVLASIGREAGLTETDADLFTQVREEAWPSSEITRSSPSRYRAAMLSKAYRSLKRCASAAQRHGGDYLSST